MGGALYQAMLLFLYCSLGTRLPKSPNLRDQRSQPCWYTAAMDPTAERKCQWSGQGIEVPAGHLPGKHVLVGGCLREDGKNSIMALMKWMGNGGFRGPSVGEASYAALSWWREEDKMKMVMMAGEPCEQYRLRFLHLWETKEAISTMLNICITILFYIPSI